ncbi:alpha/beta hydrolase [Gallaecimonas kandeliae]|uniref:alpha/beta fold hydrolase n=1 Tax=Gallaecimonas kandeliae TaxID=3029055 RepID=UPI0026483C9D|nr:alpha/beta hydrolase [Gallaecimonas kandeliae]WKE64426.1 alpha/beta hydrolase [Gallaecimonas kandeliae]
MGLVYLHSSMSDSRQWRPLAQDFPGLLHDFYGYGEAPMAPAGPFSLALEAARIALNEPMTLVGHSYGAATALHLAVTQPDKVKALCLYEPVAFWLLPKENAGRQAAEDLGARMARLDASQGAQAFVDYWSGEGSFAAMPARLQQRLAAQAPKVLKDFEALIGESTDPAAITVPLLLMVGSQSPASSRAVAFELARRLPQAQLVEVDAGHMGPIQHPELVLPLMADFLKRYG